MKIDDFFTTHNIFTISEFKKILKPKPNPSTVYNLLTYYKKQGRILLIRRGLYYCVPKGIPPKQCPIDPFLVASKLAEDSVLAYRTALDLHGNLHSTESEFIYLTKKRVMSAFIFRGIKYQATSIPTALKGKANSIEGIERINRNGHSLLVTTLERTLVDVLDRPNLCGSWEEIWRSLGSIAYLKLDHLFEYALLLNNATTLAKVGFFLEVHQNQFMVPNNYLEKLCKYRPIKPHYMDRNSSQKQTLIAKWNLIVPTNLINQSWEEPNEDI